MDIIFQEWPTAAIATFDWQKLLYRYIMADKSRTSRKIRQGKVDIDYEDSSLIVHYDLELVRALRWTIVSHPYQSIATLNSYNDFVTKDICYRKWSRWRRCNWKNTWNEKSQGTSLDILMQLWVRSLTQSWMEPWFVTWNRIRRWKIYLLIKIWRYWRPVSLRNPNTSIHHVWRK